MSDVVLRIDGHRFGGWKSMQLQRGIEQAAGAFNLSVTERFPGQPSRWPMKKGQECALVLDGHTAITGFTDGVTRRFDDQTSGITIVGRDRTADIIDSAAVIPGTQSNTGDFGPLTLPALATQLCAPHGIQIKVASGLDLGASFAKVSIDPGETVWECLERYARQRACLLVSDGLGNLVLTRAGTQVHPQALIEGENIESAELTDDDSQRFYRYVALGQEQTSSDWNGSAALQPKGSALDDTVRTNRTQILVAETLANGVTLGQRATWERDVRRGRGKRLVVTVTGFSARGVLWEPNLLVPVKIPRFGINDRLLIQNVSMTETNDGSRSELTLVPPSLYSLLPAAGDTSTAGGAW